MRTTIFFLVLSYAACVLSAAYTRQTTDCAERGTFGLICSKNCRDVATCLRSGDQWDRIEIETCTGNQTCNLMDDGCSDKPGPCYSVGEMTCHNEGKFPDPFDCQRYYQCSEAGAKSQMKECGKDLAYNVKTNSCDLKIGEAQNCKELPAECKEEGDTGPWKGNDNVFYVCKSKDLSFVKNVLYPELFKCDGGQKYDPVYGCH